MSRVHSNGVQQKGFLASFIELATLLFVVFMIRTVVFGLYQVPTGSMETTMLTGERFFAEKLTYFFRAPRRGEIIALNDPRYNYSPNALKQWFEHYVWGPMNFTKRVIGVPGDRVRGVIEDGKPIIYLNNVRQEESYVNKYPLVRQLAPENSATLQAVLQQLGLSDGDYGRWIPKSFDPSQPLNNQPFYRIDERFVLRDEVGRMALILPDSYRQEDVFDITLKPNQYWLMGDNRRGSQDSRSFGAVDGSLIHGRLLFRIWSMETDTSWLLADLLRNPLDFWKRIRWNRIAQRVS